MRTKLPPPMRRTFRDDLWWGASVLAGTFVGWLVLAAGDVSVLLAAVVGCALVIVVLNVIRPLVRRANARAEDELRGDGAPPAG
jgi:uncharacterized membrane protein YfcA